MAPFVAETNVVPADKTSLTAAPDTVLGPLFVTVIVYATFVPGTSVAAPSVLAMDRSATGTSASVSVALLLPLVGSVTPAGGATDAVLLSVPVKAGSIARVNLKLVLSP